MLSIYDQILKTPSFVKELKEYQLEEQIQLAKKEKQDWLKWFYEHRTSTSGVTLDESKKDFLYDETILEYNNRIQLFKKEKQRREQNDKPPTSLIPGYFRIDTKKIAGDTIKGYPAFGNYLNTLEDALNDSLRKWDELLHGLGKDAVLEKIDFYQKNSLKRLTELIEQGNDRSQNEWETTIELTAFGKMHEKILETLEGGKPKIIKPTPQRTFAQCFKEGDTGVKRLLDAAVKTELVEVDTNSPNGYKWIYDGDGKTRTHGICAFWQTAKDNGLIKGTLKNTEKTTKAIELYFGLESLAKGTLDAKNEANKEFKSLKNDLTKALNNNRL